MKDPRHIVITGASSGIGRALALLYAAPGIRLALQGRDAGRLEEVAAICRAHGAETVATAVNVTDRETMRQWLSTADRTQPVDLVIANAGISAGTGSGGENEHQLHEIFAVNVEGVMNTIHPLLPAMMHRRRGQIAIMSSLAGFRGMAGAPAYCASKAAVRIYGEALRGAVMKKGVDVNVICPGYIKTPMTEVNRFPMPFLMSAEKCADIIQWGLERNKSRIAFPFPMFAAVWFLSLLPPGWTDKLLAKFPEKPSQSSPQTASCQPRSGRL